MSGNARHVINMANSIIGVSILSMPYCFKEAGLVLATLLVLLSGFMTKKTCMYLIRSAIMSRRRSYEMLAFQVFGVAGKFLMELCLICFLVGICISFHVVMGDLAPSIVANYMHTENSSSLRTTILCGIVILVILPLCLLRNIDSLASMSACSIGFYFFLNSIIFYAALPRLLDGSWLSATKLFRLDKAFNVLPIMSLALSCQSNVFEIYDSLPEPDVIKMKWVVDQAVNLCCALYIGCGFLGYIAFSDAGIGGNVIMSFPASGLTDGIKIFFVISLAISFPLMLFPCRTSIHSLIYRNTAQISHNDLVGNYMPEVRFKIITFTVLAFSLGIGIVLPNIEFVLGLLGSTMGMLIALILPSLFFIKVYTKNSLDRLFSQTLLIFGIMMMVTGTVIHLHLINIQSSSPKELLSPEVIAIPAPPAPPSVIKEIPKSSEASARKEPAVPEPPVVDVLVKKELKPPPSINVSDSKVSPKADKVEALHPDAIKHEEKESAVENKEAPKAKEVIEQKQEKILSYIEEQQKKQNEMLEILHQLKDKTMDKDLPETKKLSNSSIVLNKSPVKKSIKEDESVKKSPNMQKSPQLSQQDQNVKSGDQPNQNIAVQGNLKIANHTAVPVINPQLPGQLGNVLGNQPKVQQTLSQKLPIAPDESSILKKQDEPVLPNKPQVQPLAVSPQTTQQPVNKEVKLASGNLPNLKDVKISENVVINVKVEDLNKDRAVNVVPQNTGEKVEVNHDEEKRKRRDLRNIESKIEIKQQTSNNIESKINVEINPKIVKNVEPRNNVHVKPQFPENAEPVNKIKPHIPNNTDPINKVKPHIPNNTDPINKVKPNIPKNAAPIKKPQISNNAEPINKIMPHIPKNTDPINKVKPQIINNKVTSQNEFQKEAMAKFVEESNQNILPFDRQFQESRNLLSMKIRRRKRRNDEEYDDEM